MFRDGLADAQNERAIFLHGSYFSLLQESVLNGRLDPVGVVEGFSAEIGASGTFCPKHVTLPVTAFYFQVCPIYEFVW